MCKLYMTIAVAACAVSLLLGLAAIATSKWLVLDVGTGELKYGLFGSCTNESITGEVKCRSYNHTKHTRDWILVTSGFEVTGIGVIFLAFLLALLLSLAGKSIAAGKASGPFAFVGGFSKIVGTIIWALMYRNDPHMAICNLSDGFFLANASAVLSIIVGSLLFFCCRTKSSYTVL